MWRDTALAAAVFLTLTLLVSCGGRESGDEEPEEPIFSPKDSKPAELQLPEVPFSIQPNVPDSTYDEHDLREGIPSELSRAARQFASSGDWENASKFAYWAVDGGAQQNYNLACYMSRAGKVDDAFYWLQTAALTEGADADWAAKDSDLATIRKDPRWGKVHRFLKQAGKYWRASGLQTTEIVVPDGYDPAQPIPVVVWLHGFGASPGLGNYEDMANELGVAFLGVSGTIPHGMSSFAWADDKAKDQARIDAAFEEMKERLTPEPGKILFYGFSQGAAVATELAVENPLKYAGAIVMSPGSNKEASLPESPVRGGSLQTFVISCGEHEHPDTVARSKFYSEGLERLKTNVVSKVYPGMDVHALPHDFYERFPEWITQILRLDSE